MEYKIFLLIATLCIALVKSEDEDEYDYNSEYDYSNTLPPDYEVVGYPGDFPKAVLLTDDDRDWGTVESEHSCFQNCYKKINENHKEAIVNFSEKLVEGTRQTLDKVKEKLSEKPDFGTLSQEIQNSAKKFGDLLQQYQKEFSESVEKGSSDKIKSLKKKYEDEIVETDKTLDENIRKLKEKTISEKDLFETIKTYEKNNKKALNEITDKCKELMNSLKECMEEESCKK